MCLSSIERHSLSVVCSVNHNNNDFIITMDFIINIYFTMSNIHFTTSFLMYNMYLGWLSRSLHRKAIHFIVCV